MINRNRAPHQTGQSNMMVERDGWMGWPIGTAKRWWLNKTAKMTAEDDGRRRPSTGTAEGDSQMGRSNRTPEGDVQKGRQNGTAKQDGWTGQPNRRAKQDGWTGRPTGLPNWTAELDGWTGQPNRTDEQDSQTGRLNRAAEQEHMYNTIRTTPAYLCWQTLSLSTQSLLPDWWEELTRVVLYQQIFLFQRFQESKWKFNPSILSWDIIGKCIIMTVWFG